MDQRAETDARGRWLKADYRRLAERRGKNIAAVAMARKIIALTFYALRDGEVRCLRHAA